MNKNIIIIFKLLNTKNIIISFYSFFIVISKLVFFLFFDVFEEKKLKISKINIFHVCICTSNSANNIFQAIEDITEAFFYHSKLVLESNSEMVNEYLFKLLDFICIASGTI